MAGFLKGRLAEVLKAVGPLLVAVSVLQFAFVQAPAALFLQFLGGAALAIVGMVLLFAGIDRGILPMGRFIGAELPRTRSLGLILAVAFALSFATTVAEPDVLVLAGQVETMTAGRIAGQPLVYAIAAGVGLFTALAVARIVWGLPMAYLLAATYLLMLLLSFFSPPQLVALAYAAGSVTTGVLTAPVVLALALGFASVLGERSAVSDGFGLLGVASAGAIIVVLAFGIVLQ